MIQILEKWELCGQLMLCGSKQVLPISVQFGASFLSILSQIFLSCYREWTFLRVTRTDTFCQSRLYIVTCQTDIIFPFLENRKSHERRRSIIALSARLTRDTFQLRWRLPEMDDHYSILISAFHELPVSGAVST